MVDSLARSLKHCLRAGRCTLEAAMDMLLLYCSERTVHTSDVFASAWGRSPDSPQD